MVQDMRVETCLLRPDHPTSRVIKGGWQLAGDHGAVDRAAAISDMEAFLDAGITNFDCADIYTGVEEMIGSFISDVRQRRGSEVADKVCVHTKLVPDMSILADATEDQIEAMVDRSLQRLGLDTLHLVQFFWWDMSIGDPVRVLSCLKHSQEKGKIRHLGITNWDWPEIEKFTDAGLDIISAQVQYSVLDRRPETGLVDWAGKHNMQLLCYGSLAGGFLTESWLGKPDPGFSFENRSLIKYRLIIDEFGPWERFQTLLETLKSIGDRHGVGLSAVATRYVLDRPGVAAAIVGARYARYLPQTLEVFQFQMTDQDYSDLNAVLDLADGPNGGVYGLEKDRTGRHGRIMKYNLNTSPDAKTLAAEQGS